MTFPCSPSLLLLSCCLRAGEPGCHGNWAVKHPEPAASPLGEGSSREAQRRGWLRGNRSWGVERWKADRVRNGFGLFCEDTAQEEYIGHKESRHFGEKQDNHLLPAFVFTTVQISLCLLPPIHLLSGSNTLSVCTYHIIKGIFTIPNIDHTPQGLFIARKSADYNKQIVWEGLRHKLAEDEPLPRQ